MPIERTSRADLRVLARIGDVDAAVELAKRCRAKTLKALMAQAANFEVEMTPALFDTCCDASDRLGLPSGFEKPPPPKVR